MQCLRRCDWRLCKTGRLRNIGQMAMGTIFRPCVPALHMLLLHFQQLFWSVLPIWTALSYRWAIKSWIQLARWLWLWYRRCLLKRAWERAKPPRFLVFRGKATRGWHRRVERTNQLNHLQKRKQKPKPTYFQLPARRRRRPDRDNVNK